jgi:hypothetical protein
VVRICNIYIFVGVKRDVPLGRARAAVEATAWHLGHAVRESARWIRAGRERLKTR